MGVKVMLADNMGGGAVNVLNAHDIKVYRGCTRKIREVAEAWLVGKVNDSGAGYEVHEGCDAHG